MNCMTGKSHRARKEAEMRRLGFVRKIKGRDVVRYLFFVLIILCIRSSVFASYHVPTGSMSPTILEGEFFFANKLAYRLKLPFTKATVVDWKMPERGDIVIFRYPPDESQDYTKRVIGVPGDTVEIIDKDIYINGTAVGKRYIDRSGGAHLFEEDLFGTRYAIRRMPFKTPFDTTRRTVVPEGALFVMGDNRDNSLDSRAWGFVPLENVEGKMIVRWFSLDPDTHIPRFDRIGLIR